MGYTLRIEDKPSCDLRDWLESDLFVTLHCSQPKFEIKLLEENTDQQKDVVLDTDGLPKLEHKTIGVSTD